MRVRTLILLIFFTGNIAYGQTLTTCEELVRRAEIAFDAGNFKEVLKVRSCLDKLEFSPQSRDSTDYSTLTRARRLMTLYYLLHETAKEDSAKLYFVRLLRSKRNFRPLNSDPEEFKHLYHTFRTWPVARLRMQVGGLIPLVRTIGRYGLDNTEVSAYTYFPQIDLTGGVGIDIPLNDTWEISVDVMFAKRSFAYENSLVTFLDNQSFSKLSYVEKHRWVDGACAVKYRLPFGSSQWGSYFYTGVSGTYLAVANLSELSRINTGTGSQQETNAKITDLRRRWNYGALAGAGITLEWGLHHWFADLRYTGQFQNLTRPENRYKPDILVNSSPELYTSDLLYTYGYVSNDFVLNNLSFSLGLSLSLYRTDPQIRKKR